MEAEQGALESRHEQRIQQHAVGQNLGNNAPNISISLPIHRLCIRGLTHGYDIIRSEEGELQGDHEGPPLFSDSLMAGIDMVTAELNE